MNIIEEGHISEDGFVEDGTAPPEEYFIDKDAKQRLKEWACSILTIVFILIPWSVGLIYILGWIFF
jgi:hypothetical protein